MPYLSVTSDQGKELQTHCWRWSVCPSTVCIQEDAEIHSAIRFLQYQTSNTLSTRMSKTLNQLYSSSQTESLREKNYLQDSSEILLTWNIAGATEKTWATMLSAHKHPPCYSPHDKNKWHHLISSLSVLPLQAGWRASRERLGKAQTKWVGRQKQIEASPCCSAPSIMHSVTVQYWLGFLAGKTLLGINPQRNAVALEDADEP